MRHLKVFIISILLVSSLVAKEDLHPYKFKLEETISGFIIAEGNIFPNNKTTLITLIDDIYHKKKSRIEFLDDDLKVVEKRIFPLPFGFVQGYPLVFDFDGDSYDEVFFTFSDSNKVWIEYFDPSNNTQLWTKIFEMSEIKETHRTYTNLFKTNSIGNKKAELILYVRETNVKHIINWLGRINIEKKEVIWGKFSAENITSHLFTFEDDTLSYLIYSGRSNNSNKKKYEFSNGHYFVTNEREEVLVYDINCVKKNGLQIDTTSTDYSSDAKGFIRAVDKNNNLLWERYFYGKSVIPHIDTIAYNGSKKLLLATFSTRTNSKIESTLQIVNPRNGEVENKIIFKNQISKVVIFGNRILVAFRKEKLLLLDLSFNILSSSSSETFYSPNDEVIVNNKLLYVVKKGSSIYKKILLMDDNLNTLASLKTNWPLRRITVTNNLVNIPDASKNTTNFYSIQSIPWYNRISTEDLKTFTTIILISLVIILLMWSLTLRVSWKKIGRQNKELETTHNELKTTTSKLIQAEKLAVYGTIASSIAHEINSPLGAIINSAQRIKENKDADIEQNINLIERAGKRAKSIIEKLLVGTRNSNGKAKSNLREVVTEWRELSDKQFENLGIELDIKLNCDPELAISSTELNQILTNILFNARDSIMERNGGRKSITITADAHEGNCKVIIRDTGTGFSTTKLEKPFEAFNTSKEKGKGTGLGLWVVKSIIDNIGGKINIRNYGMGAEVELIIPLFTETKNEQ